MLNGVEERVVDGGGDRDRERILALCELSKRTIGPMYVSMGLLVLGGVLGNLEKRIVPGAISIVELSAGR